MDEYPSRHELQNMIQQTDPPDKARHLLRVAAAVNNDAQQAWAELWGELKPHVTTGGMAMPSLDKGFVPTCGWPEFLERMWLLKHYQDSIHRICQEECK